MSRCEDNAEIHHSDFNWIDGAEHPINYRPEGYHPVMAGDVLHDRYLIVDKLGWGGYSTVWLAHDMHHEAYVAVKIGVAITNSLSQEMKCLHTLSAPSPHPGHDAIPTPLDEFEVRGPNGTHPCYTMLPAGCNLREASGNDMFTLDVARALIGELTMAVSHMHSCGYVHGDIRLSNVLLKLPSSLNHLSVEQFCEEYGDPQAVPITFRKGKPLPPGVPPKAILPLGLSPDIKAKEFKLHDAHILLSDFGESYSPSSEIRRGEDCHTPLGARPPEAKFEPQTPLSYSADIWSLAVAIWEIFAMKTVFSNEFVSEDEMISYHIDVLGPMPKRWWVRWEARGEYFEQDGRPKQGRYQWPDLEQAFDGECVQDYRRKFQVGVFGEEERRAVLNLMRRMLTFEPEKRPTVEEVLESEWMAKWVLPDWERCRNNETRLANGDDVGEGVGKISLFNGDDVGEGVGKENLPNGADVGDGVGKDYIPNGEGVGNRKSVGNAKVILQKTVG